MSKEITLGATYEDRITGFRGVATGYVQYLTGCNQVLLAPRADSGKDSAWYDVQRLKKDEDAQVIVLDNSGNPGCDKAAPIR